jgi:hypothetical protein
MVGKQQELTTWRIRRALSGLSWTGAVGVVAIVFATGFYISTLAPLNAQIEQGRDELAALYAQYGDAARRTEPDSPQHQLDTFYEHLQSQEYVAEVVRRLHRNARAVGLRFERGDYRPLRDASGKVLRYQITLPLLGSYPKVRRFLAQSMDEEPALALEGIGFQKESTRGRLETQVNFTLFVRGKA